MSDTLTDEITEQDERTIPAEPGDHDKMSHYARNEDIVRAMVEGIPCTALCGKTWLPTRDGKKFPTCPECKEIYEGLAED